MKTPILFLGDRPVHIISVQKAGVDSVIDKAIYADTFEPLTADELEGLMCMVFNMAKKLQKDMKY